MNGAVINVQNRPSYTAQKSRKDGFNFRADMRIFRFKTPNYLCERSLLFEENCLHVSAVLYKNRLIELLIGTLGRLFFF